VYLLGVDRVTLKENRKGSVGTFSLADLKPFFSTDPQVENAITDLSNVRSAFAISGEYGWMEKYENLCG